MVCVENLQMLTSDYHTFTLYILPLMKLSIKVHKQITSSLLSENIKSTYHYFMSGRYSEDRELVSINHVIKLQEVAPMVAHHGVSQQLL